MHTIELASEALDAILSHAVQAHPHECCGLLLGEGGRITHAQATANVHPDPATHFEIDPRALIEAHRTAREGGSQIIGYYHSHPEGDASPSSTDCAHAAHDRKVWAIATSGSVEQEIRFFRDGEDGFEPLSYAVQPR